MASSAKTEVPSSSTSSDVASSLAQAQRLVQHYHKQLTVGCSNSSCGNDYCVSSGRREGMEPNEAAAEAIRMALQQKDARLCQPLSEKEEETTTTRRDCRILSRKNLDDTPQEEIGEWLGTVFSHLGLLSRSFPNEEEDEEELCLDVDVAEARSVLNSLLDDDMLMQDTIISAISRLSDGILNRGAEKLGTEHLSAFAIIMELPLLTSMAFYEAFAKFLKAANLLPDLAKVRLVKFWSRQGAEWLLEHVEAMQQYLTIHLLQSTYTRHASVQADRAVVEAVGFMELFWLASLYGGERDDVVKIRAEQEFNKAEDRDVEAFFSAAKAAAAEFAFHQEDEDTWIRQTEGRVQRSLGLRRIDVHKPLLADADFHNQTLAEHIQPDKDFLNFKAQETRDGEDDCKDGTFSFLRHHFILLPTVKMEEMFYDNRILMHKYRRRAAFQAHFMGMMESQFLTLSVTRENAVMDALGQLELVMKEVPRDLKKQLRVVFQGEPGVDEGGPSKEFYQIITEQLFNPDYGMFTYNESTHRYWFRPGSAMDAEAEFTLIGCLFGLAIYNSILVNVAFPLPLYLKLLGKLPGFRYLADLDPTLHASLSSMLSYEGGDMEDVFCATFEVAYTDAFGDTRTHALVPDGADKAVTKENCQASDMWLMLVSAFIDTLLKEYVELYADFLLNQSAAAEFHAFRKGFKMVTHESCLESLFGPVEIEQLVCGTTEFRIPDLQKSTRYDNGYDEEHQVIKWFWEVVREMSETEQRQLLSFATGADRVPVLLLPEYGTKERLKERLLKAILYSRGFGLQ